MRSLILQRINANSIVRRLTSRSTIGTTARPTLASCQQRFSSSDAPKRRPRRKKQKYEQFSEAKLATGVLPTTTSLESPFEYNSGDSIEDYKKKAELSPWTPVPDSVARKIFDRAIPPENDYSDRSKEDEVSLVLQHQRVSKVFRISASGAIFIIITIRSTTSNFFLFSRCCSCVR